MGFHHRAPPLLSALPCLLPLDIFRLVTLIYHRTEPPDAERSYRKCSVEGHSTVIKAIVLIPCSLSIPPPPLPLPPSIILDAISITLFTPTPALLLPSVSTLPLGLSLRQSRGTETRRRSFRGTLILCSHNRSQNQSSPHAQPIHPRLLSFECALRRGWGGFWSNQWRIAPPKAASTSRGAAAHISGYTARHKDTWLGASSLFIQTSRFQAGGAQKAAEFIFPLSGFLSHATPWACWTHGVVFVS